MADPPSCEGLVPPEVRPGIETAPMRPTLTSKALRELLQPHTNPFPPVFQSNSRETFPGSGDSPKFPPFRLSLLRASS